MRGQLSIDTLFAFVARDKDGTEGIMGFLSPTGWIPMIGADEARIKSLEPKAQETANAMGITIQLVEFSKRREVRVIEPTKKRETTRLGGEDSSIIDIK